MSHNKKCKGCNQYKDSKQFSNGRAYCKDCAESKITRLRYETPLEDEFRYW